MEASIRCRHDGALLATLSGDQHPEVVRWCIDKRLAQGRSDTPDDLDEWLDKHPGYVLTKDSWPPSGWVTAPIDIAQQPGDYFAVCPKRGCTAVHEMWFVVDLLVQLWASNKASRKI